MKKMLHIIFYIFIMLTLLYLFLIRKKCKDPHENFSKILHNLYKDDPQESEPSLSPSNPTSLPNESDYIKFLNKEYSILEELINKKIEKCYPVDERIDFPNINVYQNLIYNIKNPLSESFLNENYYDVASLFIQYTNMISPVNLPWFLEYINANYDKNNNVKSIDTKYNLSHIIEILYPLEVIKSVDELNLDIISNDKNLIKFLNKGIVDGKIFYEELKLENKYKNNFDTYTFSKILSFIFVCYFIINISNNSKRLNLNCDKKK